MPTTPLRQRAANRLYSPRLLTIRTTVSDDFLWPAVCSGCPFWFIQDEPFRVFNAAVKLHRIIHARNREAIA